MSEEEKYTETILVVDDEEAIRSFLKRLLMRFGCESVEEACNAAEGYEVLKKVNPALLILDIHMPGESGISLLKKVKEQFPDTQVVVITASDDSGNVNTALASGADGYAVKPVNIEEFRHAVLGLLEKRRLILENRQYKRELGR